MQTKPQPKIGFLMQLGIFLGSTGVLAIIGSLLVSLLAASLTHTSLFSIENALKNPANSNVLRLVNTLGAFIILCLPALVLAIFVGKKPVQFLGFNAKISGKQVFLVIVLSVVCIFLSNSLGALNELIPMPASFIKKAKAMEKSYAESVAVMANMKNMQDYLLSLLTIAFFPALFEELFFRAGLQKLLVNWSNNKWVGIILSSIIFSLIHFSWYGFLARAGLGVVLGLVFYYSKNIWLNILLHFLNNGLLVTLMYGYTRMGKSLDELEKATSGTGAKGTVLISLLTMLPICIAAVYFLLQNFMQESSLVMPAYEAKEYYKEETFASFLDAEENNEPAANQAKED